MEQPPNVDSALRECKLTYSICREHRPLTRIGQDKARTDVKSTFATLNLKHVFNYFKGMLERITVRKFVDLDQKFLNIES